MNTARIVTVLVAMAFLPLVMPVQAAMAHGVDLSIAPRDGIEVVATFEGGEAMAEAQVAVFVPDEPAEPWLTGTTDEEGRFFFVPDATMAGTWEVQVRQAGHGGIVRIEVSEAGTAEEVRTGLSNLQKAVMALAVIWGSVGTALYFRRRAA